ncbi:MAG TPA: arsenic resistance N-acetyltransferase ArsN2 [Longimicrobiales bacterium]|nr:arsenic resistance N-acetyltransferase ArsN2 [Longimicrobiales bacterium]
MSEVAMAVGAIRPAVSADLMGVEALLRASDLPFEGVAEQFEDGYVVSVVDDDIVGVAGLEVYGAYGLLRSIAVAPEWRGRGVADALVNDRVEWSAARGLRAVYLLTTSAAGYFGDRGFEVVDRDAVPASIRRSAEFSDICPATATAMELRVKPRESSCCGAPILMSSAPATAASATSCCTPGDAQPVSLRGAELTNAIDAGDAEALKAAVREKYGAAASRAAIGSKSSCCGASPDEVWDPITADLYEEAETSGLPTEAVLASLGCGNPTALAELHEGEVVLDLGSGGGIDVLLSARRVGPTGKAYGLDMTDEMLELARANQQRAGAANVEFLKGDIEAIPLPDASVDVIISNCVINLAADKSKVLHEAFRVLKPGGRFAVSDIVSTREVPADVRRSMELWMGCVAGALHRDEYASLLGAAGFEQIDVEPTRVYGAADADAFGVETGISGEELDGAFMSAFVRAQRPPA